MTLEMRSVFSSHVAKIGYDAEEERLVVEYSNGTVIEHRGVPPRVADRVINAPSIGSALHSQIKGRYDYNYIEQGESMK